jgi:peptidoglycan hydrolase-like protein with peptidoglycan-binding domain
MSNRSSRLIVHLLVALSGCAADVGSDFYEAAAPVGASVRLEDVEHELRSGESSDAVVAVQDYLTRYGYFPNPELALEFPSWRPIVAVTPERGVYDEATEAAVTAMQRSYGLDRTGVVDADTLAMMQRPRCAHPDGEQPLDPSHKFSTQGSRWTTRSVSWRLNMGNERDISAADVQSALRAAFDEVTFASGLSFPQITGTADIEVSFKDIGSRDAALAQAYFPSTDARGGDLEFNVNRTWNKLEVQSIGLHELGHSMGLLHSSLTQSVMFPSTTSAASSRTTLSNDDQLGLRVVYGRWATHPGVANDVAVAQNGDVWAAGGLYPFAVYKLRPGTDIWDPTVPGDGQPAMQAGQITVDNNGRPWVVTPTGEVYSHTTDQPTTGTWTHHPGVCARDIGSAGGTGRVWIITCEAAAGGNFKLARFSGSGFVTSNGIATRVSVDRFGCPWVVQANGDVVRGKPATCDNPVSVQWEKLTYEPIPPARFTGPIARDIAVGPTDANSISQAWIVDADGKAWVRMEQPLGPTQSDPAQTPKKHATWIAPREAQPGRALHIGAGAQRVWLVAPGGAMYLSGTGIR